MSEPEQSRTALQAMEGGEFEKARILFGDLLERHPQSAEYICGLYTAGYWENRFPIIAKSKPGRNLGSYLMREWDQFDHIAEEKGFPGCESYRAAMRSILGMVAEQYRVVFQEEGGGSVDTELLIQLGRTLIRIEDYTNAAEILQYARRIREPGAELFFLLGEALAKSEQPELHRRGLSYYRDAFFLNPQAMDPTIISSEPVSSIFLDLFERMDRRMEEVREWIPAYLLASTFGPGYRKLHEEEVEQMRWEIERLEKERLRVIEKFRQKVLARLCFYDLSLIHHYSYHDKDPDEVSEFESHLRDLDAGLYAIYRESRSGENRFR